VKFIINAKYSFNILSNSFYIILLILFYLYILLLNKIELNSVSIKEYINIAKKR
jgi:hypothetical protein